MVGCESMVTTEELQEITRNIKRQDIRNIIGDDTELAQTVMKDIREKWKNIASGRDMSVYYICQRCQEVQTTPYCRNCGEPTEEYQ